MALKVTLSRGMNGLNTPDYPEATKYEVKETPQGLALHVYDGTKRIATHAPGTWESAYLYTPIDIGIAAKKAKKPKGKSGKGTKIREGAEISTHPDHGDPAARKAAKTARKSGGKVKARR